MNMNIVICALLVSVVIFIVRIYLLYFRKKVNKKCLRPEVYVDFRFKDKMMYIVVKNFGEKAAFDINIRFIPDITYKIGGQERSLNVTPVLNNLSSLSPGEEIETFMGMGFDVLTVQKLRKIKYNVEYVDVDSREYRGEYFLSTKII